MSVKFKFETKVLIWFWILYLKEGEKGPPHLQEPEIWAKYDSSMTD